MYALRVRFTDRRACLSAMQADMASIVGRHKRRSVDAQPWSAVRNGWTVGQMHTWATAKAQGLHLAEFSEYKGSYTLRYENAEGEKLNALEAAQPKYAAVQNAISARLEADGTVPQPSAKHKAEWTGSYGCKATEELAQMAMPWDGSGGARHNLPAPTSITGTGISPDTPLTDV